MKIVLNGLWFITIGIWVSILLFFTGLLLFIPIITIPIGIGLMRWSQKCFFPFKPDKIWTGSEKFLLCILIIVWVLNGLVFIASWGHDSQGTSITHKSTPVPTFTPRPTLQSESQPTSTVEPKQTQPPSSVPVAIVQKSSNIRRGPSIDYEKILSASVGDEFNVIGKNGEWYKIKLDIGSGWIWGNLVNVSNENKVKYVSSPSTPIPTATKSPYHENAKFLAIKDGNNLNSMNASEQQEVVQDYLDLLTWSSSKCGYDMQEMSDLIDAAGNRLPQYEIIRKKLMYVIWTEMPKDKVCAVYLAALVIKAGG